MKPNLAWDYRKPGRAITIRLVVGIWPDLAERHPPVRRLLELGATDRRRSCRELRAGLARLLENCGVIKKGHHVEHYYEFPVHHIHLACGDTCRLHQRVGRSHHWRAHPEIIGPVLPFPGPSGPRGWPYKSPRTLMTTGVSAGQGKVARGACTGVPRSQRQGR